MIGGRVLVGRREGTDGELVALLEDAGFEPVSVPLIEILPPEDPEPLRGAVRRLASGAFDGVAFTSVPAVRAVLATADALGLPTPIAGATVVAAVGPGTAAALGAAGVTVRVAPVAGGSAAALVHAWPPGLCGSVLLPRSEAAPSDLPDALRAIGCQVVTVVAYRTTERPIPSDTAARLAAGDFAAVVLTSGSGARSLARHRIAPGTAVVTIGAATAAVAGQVGLTVAALAEQPTPAGLVAAVRAALDSPPSVPMPRPDHGGAAVRRPAGPGAATDAVPSAPAGPGPISEQK